MTGRVWKIEANTDIRRKLEEVAARALNEKLPSVSHIDVVPQNDESPHESDELNNV
jgi:hypothetical protein